MGPSDGILGAQLGCNHGQYHTGRSDLAHFRGAGVMVRCWIQRAQLSMRRSPPWYPCPLVFDLSGKVDANGQVPNIDFLSPLDMSGAQGGINRFQELRTILHMWAF